VTFISVVIVWLLLGYFNVYICVKRDGCIELINLILFMFLSPFVFIVVLFLMLADSKFMNKKLFVRKSENVK
jgi:hypothetical protein